MEELKSQSRTSEETEITLGIVHLRILEQWQIFIEYAQTEFENFKKNIHSKLKKIQNSDKKLYKQNLQFLRSFKYDYLSKFLAVSGAMNNFFEKFCEEKKSKKITEEIKLDLELGIPHSFKIDKIAMKLKNTPKFEILTKKNYYEVHEDKIYIGTVKSNIDISGAKKKMKKDGFGFLKEDQEIYLGEFKNGKREGSGIQIFKSGRVFQGQWKKDAPFYGYYKEKKKDDFFGVKIQKFDESEIGIGFDIEGRKRIVEKRKKNNYFSATIKNFSKFSEKKIKAVNLGFGTNMHDIGQENDIKNIEFCNGLR